LQEHRERQKQRQLHHEREKRWHPAHEHYHEREK
jgi:hypothetical protein